LIIATEFWDGIVAYMSDCPGNMANDDAGKVYCATISPKAAWILSATIRAFRIKQRVIMILRINEISLV